jgi:hypothetical protein
MLTSTLSLLAAYQIESPSAIPGRPFAPQVRRWCILNSSTPSTSSLPYCWGNANVPAFSPTGLVPNRVSHRVRPPQIPSAVCSFLVPPPIIAVLVARCPTAQPSSLAARLVFKPSIEFRSTSLTIKTRQESRRQDRQPSRPEDFKTL